MIPKKDKMTLHTHSNFLLVLIKLDFWLKFFELIQIWFMRITTKFQMNLKKFSTIDFELEVPNFLIHRKFINDPWKPQKLTKQLFPGPSSHTRKLFRIFPRHLHQLEGVERKWHSNARRKFNWNGNCARLYLYFKVGIKSDEYSGSFINRKLYSVGLVNGFFILFCILGL
jgi:hypothetical protein